MTSKRFEEMVQQHQEREAQRQEMLRLMGVVQAKFKEACRFDNLPEDTEFAVFSPDNPIEQEYNTAMAEYLEYRRVHIV